MKLENKSKIIIVLTVDMGGHGDVFNVQKRKRGIQMNKINEKNAITLIALVITIVVLLVLASVVINLSLGENGIITKSLKSGEVYNKETASERLKLMLAEWKMNNLSKGTSIEEFFNEQVAKGKITKVEKDGDNFVVSFGAYTATLGKDGNVIDAVEAVGEKYIIRYELNGGNTESSRKKYL